MTSLAIGPINTAGQAYQWCEAVRRELLIDAVSFAGTRRSTRRLDGRAHRRILHHAVRPKLIRRREVESLLRGRTHVLSESLLPLLGDARSGALADELPGLKRQGLTVGVVFHGSDVRDPARHMANLPYSFFRLGSEAWRAALGAAARRRREAVEVMGIAAHVSTPDLLLDLPGATWIPLVVDPEVWATVRPALETRTPVVLHVPSQRTPAIKGTSFIDPVLQDLDRQGRVHYWSPASIRHGDMPTLVGRADIVVEQILAGSYGVTAVEAMAAGRLVIGNVGPRTRAIMSEDPPIVDATPETLEAVMDRVLERRDEFAALAANGPDYVRRVHGGELAARALTPFLSSSEWSRARG